MEATPLLNGQIVDFLQNNGIQSHVSCGIVAVNRTSMCCASICNKLDEGDSYTMVLELIREKFMQPNLYIVWAGKTDEDYFLTIYVKTI